MWWCHLTLHIWFPIDIFSNCVSISHRLSVMAMQNVFSYLLSLGRITKIANAPSDPKMTLNVTRTLYMYRQYPWVPNCTPFCSMITCFPYKWFFGFSIGNNGEFEIFENKIVKNQQTQHFKNPQLFEDNLGVKFRTRLQTFFWFVGGLGLWNFPSHWVPCERERNILIRKK